MKRIFDCGGEHYDIQSPLWVEADSEEEAVEIALGPDCPLPDDGEYVDSSVMVDDLVEIEVST